MSSLKAAFDKKAHQTTEEKFHEMIERPIAPLITSLAIPSIMANLVTALYNLVDMYFVGHISTAASGAIGISFVAMTAIQATGFYFGQGTGNAISRYLGAQQQEKANVMASTGLVCTLIFGLLIAVVGNLFIEPLCMVAGATPTILPYAKTFISIILCGAPWMASSILLNMQLRFEGESLFSMLAITTGAVLNALLTPVLIFGFHLGIAGSAISTIVCEFIGFILLLFEAQKIGLTPLSLSWVRPSKELFYEINNGGVPSFVRQVMLGIATTLLNNAAAPFGDAAVAAMAIVQRITGFANYIQIGIGQGYQPVLGYNIGARHHERVLAGYTFALRASTVLVLAIGVITCVFAPQLIWIFRQDPQVVTIGTLTLRVASFSAALTGVAMITNFMLQTSGHVWGASILGACRLGLVLGPTVLVLSHFFGLLGVQLAQPVADLITFFVAIPYARITLSQFTTTAQVEESIRAIQMWIWE
ncbi:MAG: MATE family efflux transporter [Atopobium sp.]|uniref:MATE family efflux transporter n=1 Tax=Atopobium sp. TaxID=1872650 RepID=UPI002A750514|nr:MATE family efflux transporter [Atopobium sp.]MDY2788512.1 MATE family efflux transporter [Atopobium sp.]